MNNRHTDRRLTIWEGVRTLAAIIAITACAGLWIMLILAGGI